MADLDRLLELKERYSILDNIGKNLSSSEFQEYQSLYEKLKKAEELQNNWDSWKETIDKLQQNQKTPEDIEKIKKYDESKEKLRGLPIPEECNIYNRMTLEILLRKAELYDSICDSSATEYMVKLEKEIQQLKDSQSNLRKELLSIGLERDQLKEENQNIIIKYELMRKDWLIAFRKLKQDSKTNESMINEIKDTLFKDTGQSQYITKWDLQQIMKKHGDKDERK